MLSSILLTCLFLVAHSGHIYPQDILISPNNKNSLTEITLVFTLDTSLAPTDFLRVVLPFRLNDPQPANWDTYVNCALTGAGKLATVIPSVLPNDGTSYFIQFYTDLTPTTRSGLTANITYYVKMRGTPDLAATTGVNLPVQVLSVSTTQQGYVVYDMNAAFGTLTLADPYPSTMTVFITVPSTETNYNVLGATYKIWIDMTPKTTIKNRARVDIELTNSAFSLVSCTSKASTGEKIPLLPATFQTLSSTKIRATITQTLTAGNGAKYRWECSVTNPVLPGATKVRVKNLLGYVETVTESGLDTTGLQAATTANANSVSAWDESGHKVLLGWGYEASSPTALNIFGLYKDATPTERWYQSVKTMFKPKAALTSTNKVQVVISTVNDAGFKLLTASLYHNLPDFSVTDKVSCSQQVQGYIHCINVGNLANTGYFVSFRFGLLSTTAAIVVTDFGKVSVQSMDTTPVVLIPLSLTTLTYQSIRANVGLWTSSSTNGIIAYSTTKAASTTTKYVTNGEDVILKFAFNYFNSVAVPLITGSNIERGIEFYTSQALASSTSPTCTINTLTQTTDIVISDCSVTQVAASAYTRLRFRIASIARITSGTPPYNLFTANNLDGTINFDKVNFASTQFSSLNYVSTNTFDYYARWVQNFTASNPTIVTAAGTNPFFFNSIVYKTNALAKLYVGHAFMMTGQTAADVGNDGTYFPTLIRIQGDTVTELAGMSRILVFFNDLEPLNKANPCFSSVASITCKYNANAADTTQVNSMTDYSGSRRLEIDFAGATVFNIYVPVKTTTMKFTYGYFVAVASAIDATATSQGIFITQHMKRIDNIVSAVYNTTTSTIIDASGPRLSVTGGTLMGGTISTYIQSAGSTYLTSTVNSATQIGAAYAYCANYDFTSAASFSMTAYSGADAGQKCVVVKYSPSSIRDVTCNVCPIHTTQPNANSPITNFKMPTMAGRDLAELVYVVGDNTGDWKRAAKDNQATVLTAFTLTGLSLTFNPVDFKKTSKGVYATIAFTTVSALPKKIRINITPTITPSLYFIPVTGVPCRTNTVTSTSCVMSGTAPNVQFDIVASANWPAGAHTIDFMVDSSGTAGLNSDTTVTYKTQISVDGISTTVVHHDSSTSTYIVKMTAAMDLVMDTFTYLFTNKNARSIISFKFTIPTDIKVQNNQKILINMGEIATANSGQIPYCLIRDPVTLVVVSDFSICDTTDLTQVALQPKAAVGGSYVIELGFLRVHSSAAPAGISIKVMGYDGTTVVAQSSTPLVPTIGDASTITPTNNVKWDRIYSDPGEVAEVILNIKPSAKKIVLGTFLYIYFPNYYADKLGYQNIYCTANDLPISCFVIKSRLMQLTSFPVEIPIGTNVQIRIFGVITPVVPVPPGKVFVGLASQAKPYLLDEQIEFSDKASNSALPSLLSVDFYTVTTNKIRDQADHTITFTTSATGIKANKKISIDFPDRWGGTLRGQEGPYIVISKTGDNVVTLVQAVSFGSRFKITLPMDLDPSSSYQFVIKGIDNPEQPVCSMDRPMIIVTDENEYAATQRTTPNIWDVPMVSYISDPNLKSLSWTDKTGTPLLSLTLTIGIFSPEIRLVPPTGENFNGDLTFTTSQTAISILPGVLQASRGSSYLSLRVGAPISQVPSIVLLDLNKDEAYANSIYTQAPKLQLILTNQVKTVPVPAISIMPGGTSLPYSWDLSALDLIPHTDVKFTVTIPAGSKLSVVGPSTITFTSDAPKTGFVFALDATATAGSPPTFTLAIDGTDKTYYAFDSTTSPYYTFDPVTSTVTVTVTVITANNAAPVLSTATPTLNYAATQQEFTINSDQMASVYWHVALQNKLVTTDCLRVRSSANAGTAYSATSSDQAQYGVFYVTTPATPVKFVIGNLIANTVYSYILCPASQMDQMGTSSTATFTTKDNSATYSQLTLTFSSAINRNQLASILCVFVKELQLPNGNVVALDGTTCASPSVFDSFATYSYTSIPVIVSGDRKSDAASTTVTTLTADVAAITANTPGNFLTSFNQALQGAGIKNLFQGITLAAGSTYPLPVLSTTATVTASATTNTITLSGLKLSSGTGIFYAIATKDTTNLPTISQIRNKVNPDGTSTSGANALFDGSTGVTLSFTGLSANTKYMIYYYATNADRTQYARATETKYVEKRTDPEPEPIEGSRLGVGFLTMVVVGLCAWLI